MSRGRFEVLGPLSPPGLPARVVRVYLPEGWSRDRPRPLLVMFDGQNVFDDAPSFAGGWHLDAAVDRLGKRRPIPIVAAVHHGGVTRNDELSPWAARGSAGAGDRFLDWVAGDLVSHLVDRYNTVRGPVGVATGGSSLGGLASMYLHFRRPEVIGGALAFSPSFWFAGQRIFDFVGAQSNPWTSRIYLDGGAREGAGMLQLARRMEGMLRARGYGEDKLKLVADPKGTHSERDWRRRALPALRFMYR